MKFSKQMIVSLALMTSIFSQSAAFASSNDVRSSGKASIKVTINGDKRKFEFCKNQKANSCVLLGEREYSISELRELRSDLEWTLAASATGTALASACALLGVFTGGAALIGAVETFHVAGSIAATAATIDAGGAAFGATLIAGSVSGSVIAFTSKYNPVSVYERMDSVNEEIVQDKDVSIKGGDAAVKEIAKTLDEALNEI
jgi:hypothetical protein